MLTFTVPGWLNALAGDQIGGSKLETLPLPVEFKYPGSSFKSDETMTCDKMDQGSGSSVAVAVPVCCEAGVQFENEALCLPVYLCPYPHLWS